MSGFDIIISHMILVKYISFELGFLFISKTIALSLFRQYSKRIEKKVRTFHHLLVITISILVSLLLEAHTYIGIYIYFKCLLEYNCFIMSC